MGEGGYGGNGGMGGGKGRGMDDVRCERCRDVEDVFSCLSHGIRNIKAVYMLFWFMTYGYQGVRHSLGY